MATAAVAAPSSARLPPRWRSRPCDSSSPICCSLLRKTTRKPTNFLVHYSHSSDRHQISRDSVDPPVEDVAAEGGSCGDKEDPMVRNKGVGRFLRMWRVFALSRKFRSIVLLNVLGIIYASNIPIIKEIEVSMDPALFNMVRFTISSILFLPFMCMTGDDGQTVSNGLELGCWITLGYLAEALGLLTSEAGRASFLTQFMVIVVPLMDGFLGATIPLLTWLAAIVSIIGVAMLESSGSPPCIGDLLNLLSAVFFGIHTLRTEHISKTTKKEKMFALLGYQVFMMALFSIIWYFSSGMCGEKQGIGSLPPQWTTVWDWMVSFPWVPALYTGIFSSGLCLWAEMHAMCDVSATETAIIYGLEPVWGASFAWLFLGERWGIAGWIGAALILGGSLTVQIFGSVPESTKNVDASDGQVLHINLKRLDDHSLSNVVIDSTKNARMLPKKHDKS